MNKKIYIDGVDVSGCEHYCYSNITNQHYCYSPAPDHCGNKDCYYKQLKRKEQECEKLKQTNDEKNELLAQLGCPTIGTAKRLSLTLKEQISELKAENERLKKLKFKSDGIELLQDANLNLHNANVKYRQALQEIRDIANIIYNTNCNYVAESHKIIDKINEVIGVEE